MMIEFFAAVGILSIYFIISLIAAKVLGWILDFEMPMNLLAFYCLFTGWIMIPIAIICLFFSPIISYFRLKDKMDGIETDLQAIKKKLRIKQ